jgi:mono/diheme cytochrome c family protein
VARVSVQGQGRPLKSFKAIAGLGGVSILAAAGIFAAISASAVAKPTPTPAEMEQAADHMLTQYCAGCHSDAAKAGGMSVQGLKATDLAAGQNIDTWEKILRRLSRGEMPPKNMPRPSDEELHGVTAWIESSRATYAAAHPDPGRMALRRLNRSEYSNAVRDLLAYDIDVSSELPADDASYGFDNIADALSVSPTLIDRYIAVAGKISRTAAGLNSEKPFVTTYVTPKDGSLKNIGKPAYNERASEDLPLDSRGGAAFKYYAPYDGVYEIRAYLNANTNTELDLLAENLFKVRTPMRAGMHTIGMSFPKVMALDESPQTIRNDTFVIIIPDRLPETLNLNVQVDGVRVKTIPVPSYQMGPRFSQNNFPRDVQQMEVEGPFEISSKTVDTPSRHAIFSCHPSASVPEEACAKTIVTNLAHRAYRRPVTPADITPLMKVYHGVRQDSDFDHAIAGAVQAVLVSPQFLFLEERAPAGAKPGSAYKISDLELASRLSFFLWSSIPDDQLLAAAEKGELKNPAVLKQQVARMMRDPKAQALTKNFAAQWLYLRSLDQAHPDVVEFPEFDTPLRQAMKAETEMFFSSVVRENSSVLDFLDSNYTYLNQRLAAHYGIPGVYGSSFRRVALDPSYERGGLLGQGSILTVTSYANHTSVVKRGQWILENILASAPPPPPPNIPALVETKNGRKMTAREQMEMHRANPVCASCHQMMDPLGFALENYDAVGAWRQKDSGQFINAVSVLPSGDKADGPAGLKKVLLGRKDQFVEAFSERLLTYGLGRGLKSNDMPAVRKISAQAAQDNYRINAIVMGIVTSDPFVMKRTSGQ